MRKIVRSTYKDSTKADLFDGDRSNGFGEAYCVDLEIPCEKVDIIWKNYVFNNRIKRFIYSLQAYLGLEIIEFERRPDSRTFHALSSNGMVLGSFMLHPLVYDKEYRKLTSTGKNSVLFTDEKIAHQIECIARQFFENIDSDLEDSSHES